MKEQLDSVQELWGKAAAAAKLIGRRPPVAPTPYDVVYAHNKLRLLRFWRPEGAGPLSSRGPIGQVPPRHGTPLLIVPSLINRYYILDLLPERSLVAYLVSQGHDVLLLDWGRPSGEDRFTTLDDHIDRLLHRCVQRAADLGQTGQVSLIGQCMGGTLAVIYAAVRPERVRNLVTLTAPVDFSAGGLLTRWTDPAYSDVDKLVDTLGNVPWPLMQASFHMLVPTLVWRKLLYLYDRIADDDFMEHFMALETWANDNVSFPGECFRRYVRDLYQANRLINGGLPIAGRTARLAAITCPVLNVAALGDHVVPLEAARALNERIGSKDQELWELPGGHLGAVVSRSATHKLWPRLDAWLAQRAG